MWQDVTSYKCHWFQKVTQQTAATRRLVFLPWEPKPGVTAIAEVA